MANDQVYKWYLKNTISDQCTPISDPRDVTKMISALSEEFSNFLVSTKAKYGNIRAAWRWVERNKQKYRNLVLYDKSMDMEYFNVWDKSILSLRDVLLETLYNIPTDRENALTVNRFLQRFYRDIKDETYLLVMDPERFPELSTHGVIYTSVQHFDSSFNQGVIIVASDQVNYIKLQMFGSIAYEYDLTDMKNQLKIANLI